VSYSARENGQGSAGVSAADIGTSPDVSVGGAERRRGVAEAASALLRIRDLDVSYRIDRKWLRACRSVSFDVQPQEALGIVGESGSGKSSVLMALARLLPTGSAITAGQIQLAGAGDIVSMSSRQIRAIRGSLIGYVPQQPMAAFNPTTMVGRQVAEALLIHEGGRYGDLRERVSSALESVGLLEVARVMDAFPHQLSGGMLQRAMIAGAVISNPKVLLADEPTSALDVTLQRRIVKLIRQVQVERGLAVVIVSHDLAMMSRVADRIAVLYAGRIVEVGATEDILQRARHPYTRALLDGSITRSVRPKNRLPELGGAPLSLAEADAEVGCPFRHRCARVVDSCAKSFPDWTMEGSGFACYNPVPASDNPVAAS
jgi:oligopeptide/dipeptide ABC transporter ATP-binding protein